MERITASLNKRKAGTSYDLLRKGLAAESAMLRLRAEAERVYPSGSKIGGYVGNWYDEVETYITESTADYEKLSELEMDASIAGDLSLNEMIRRRDRLNERIALRQEKGNIAHFNTNTNNNNRRRASSK